MEKKTGSFVKGAAILAAAGLIVKAIGAVYRIPLATIVGLEGMSFYEVAYPYYSGLLVISSAGLPTAISKLVAERVTLGDHKGAREVFVTAMKMLTIIGVATMLIMFLAADLLAPNLMPESALSIRALAPALLFASIMCAYRGYLQGLQLMTGTAVSQVVEQLGKLGVGFYLAAKLMPKGPEYAAMGALIGVSVSELLALVVMMFFYARRRRELAPLWNQGRGLPGGFFPISKRLLATAIPVTLGALIMPLTGVIDSNMIVSILVNDLGFNLDIAKDAFSILRSHVTPIINMPAVITTALAMSLVPAISVRVTAKNRRGVREASLTGLKLALIVGAPCAAGLFVLGGPVIDLLFTKLNQEQVLLAGDIMRTASIGILFLSLVQTMTGIIQGMGRPMVSVINLVFGGVLKVVTMLILMRIPNINIQGASISTVVCYAAAGILDTLYVIRRTGMKIHIGDVFIKPLFSSVVMGVGASLVYNLLHQAGHNALATLFGVGAGAVIYIAFVFIFKMLSPEELSYIPGGKRLTRLMYRRK